MAEKNDWAKLSKKELLEMLQRQEKLLANKKFLQSLPDKGRKVSQTVEQLKQLIAQKERLEDTVAQFERLTVSQLVQRTQLDVVDSDDSDDAHKMQIQSSIGHAATSEEHTCKETTSSKHRETTDTNNSKTDKQLSSKSSGRTWDYESSATPPTYKLEKAKPLSLEQSFKLLQDQEKRQKILQAQHATQKLREQSSLTKTDFTTLQVLNPLQYRETVHEECLSDDSLQDENDIKCHEMDSDDDDDDDNDKENP
ncbi:hypothetical protein ACROYT_G000065 [Oculina patagonica]